MAMPTESKLRIPAWLIVALVVVGVALGLWQVGALDHSTDGKRSASGDAAAGQARSPAQTSSPAATAGEFVSPINRANGRVVERPMNTVEQLASELDPQAREESIALQDAVAAEQASH